ncbi:MAG: hypothetical protein Q9175_006865 [Cornicularia normoerica]
MSSCAPNTFRDDTQLAAVLEYPSFLSSAGKIEDGEVVNIECVDWTVGQIKNNDDADDVRDVDLTQIHHLSGPFEVPGTESEDMRAVGIVDLQPFPDQFWDTPVCLMLTREVAFWTSSILTRECTPTPRANYRAQNKRLGTRARDVDKKTLFDLRLLEWSH